jgi:hypothetical protein
MQQYNKTARMLNKIGGCSLGVLARIRDERKGCSCREQGHRVGGRDLHSVIRHAADDGANPFHSPRGRFLDATLGKLTYDGNSGGVAPWFFFPDMVQVTAKALRMVPKHLFRLTSTRLLVLILQPPILHFG